MSSPSPKRKEYRYLQAIVELTGTAMWAVPWPRLTWAFDIYGGDDDHFPIRRVGGPPVGPDNLNLEQPAVLAPVAP